MSDEKYDGVVEAVRIGPDGRVALVRVYERRGPTWSDRVLLSRDQFIQRLKTKKQFMVGERIDLLAGTFKVRRPVWLEGPAGQEVIVSRRNRFTRSAREEQDGHDQMESVPLF